MLFDYGENMKEIESAGNPTIKLIKSLKMAKYRKETGLYIVEGERLVNEALNYDAPAYIVYSKIYGGKRINDDNAILTSAGVFESLCDTKSPQGILAVMRMKKEPLDNIKGNTLVVLEGVQNPLNVGTIIRTADAFGAGGVILSQDCADIYSPKVLRGTMGSIYHLPVFKAEDFYDCIQDYKNKGFKLIAGDLHGSDVSSLDGRCILAIGNEGNGITDKLRTMCDVLWRINMPGKAESLNAAVAAGIMLYTLTN